MSQDRTDKGFWADTALVAASNLLVKSRTLLAVPLLAWNLGMGGLGAWSQVWASANLIAAIAPFNVHVFMIRQVASGAEGSKSAYSSALAFASATGLLVVLAMVFARSTAGSLMFGESGFSDLAAWTGILAFALSIRGVALNQYRAHHRFLQRSAFEILASVLELAVLFVGWKARLALPTLVLWVVVGNLAISTVAAIDVLRLSPLQWPDAKFIRQAVAYGVPLLPLTLGNWVLDRIDRFFIANHLGLAALGEYSTVYSLAGVVLIFQAPVQMTLFPRISQHWATKADQALLLVEKCLVVLVSLSVISGALIGVMCTQVIRRILPAATSQDLSLTCAAVSFGLCAYSVFSVTSLIFHAEMKTRILGIASGAAALLNILLNFALIPPLGILGAAIATGIAHAGPAGLLLFLTRAKLDWLKLSRPPLLVAIGVVPGIVLRCTYGGSTLVTLIAAGTVFAGGVAAALLAWRLDLLKRWF